MVLKRLLHAKVMVLLVIVIILTMALPLSAHAQSQVHVVRRGDTLYSIARRYGTSVQAVMNANGLTNRNFIWAGQRLTIPGTSSGGSSSGGSTSSGGAYVVRRGDTLYSIARRYGTSVQAISQANGLVNPSQIYVGQSLKIPTSGGSSSAPPGGTTGCRVSHTVKRGEWIWQIARNYGVSPYDIMTANGMSIQTSTIHAGQVLCIP